ncbi:MAG: carbonate dehydratase [Candidatus Omnitrophota bacterium]|nr:carbonate dehydratase [Candidatus Omnitrophota bacterium]
MIRKNPQGDLPQIHKTVYVDPAAVVIGKVNIGKNVFVAPGAIIRADESKSLIIIGDNCNIQDRVVIHALSGSKVIIGKNSSLAHGCMVHGPAKIGKNCFIGFGSIVFKSQLADGVIVKHLVVVENADIPEKKLIPNGEVMDRQNKVKNLECASREIKQFCQQVVETNLKLRKGYLRKRKR